MTDEPCSHCYKLFPRDQLEPYYGSVPETYIHGEVLLCPKCFQDAFKAENKVDVDKEPP